MTPSSAAGIGNAGVVLSTPTWRGHLLYTFSFNSGEKGYDTVNGIGRRERESRVCIPFCRENKEAKPTVARWHLPRDQKHFCVYNQPQGFIDKPGLQDSQRDYMRK